MLFSGSAASLGTDPALFGILLQQHLPGRSLLAAFPGSASRLGAGSKEYVYSPGPPTRAAGERASLLDARPWVAPGGGVWRGLSVGHRPRAASGPQPPSFSKPWIREGRRGEVVAPAGGPGNGPAHAARWYFCLACPEPGSATARVRGSSAELEGKKKNTKNVESPGYLQSVDLQSVLAKNVFDLLQSHTNNARNLHLL